MRNILIIGANGFTGRQLLKDLSAHKQYNVTGCSLHSDIFPALENTKKYRFIEVDIRYLQTVVTQCFVNNKSEIWS